MPFSRKARRLAAAAREALRERDDLEEPPAPDNKRESEPVDRAVGAPLDRRRMVLFTEMSDDDLARSHQQAINRVNRTNPSADLKRYRGYLDDIEIEIASRERPTEDAQSLSPDEVEEPENTPTVDLESAVEPDLDPEEDDPISRARRERGMFFVHPNDTPESPLI